VVIEVTATGVGEFEYSVDGENYQDSNRLEVFPGEYTVYVRDRFLCRTLEKEIIALGYQKFFTPNGDGSHEHWNIIGAENYLNSKLYIYDRYGKLIVQVLPDGPGWDGTFRGVAMPSSDYWFRYDLEGGRSFTGHFTLKR
jgi:gliding motility-associated-like protein